MRIFLLLLFVLCASSTHGVFDGTCPRKDPPPGVLVLSPGSKLSLACSGHVEVDGVKVSMSHTNSRGSSSDATTANIISNTEVVVKSGQHAAENMISDSGENRRLGHAGSTASPTAHKVRPTGVSRLPKGDEEMDGESSHEEEDEEEGNRVTRGIKPRPQWKWNGRTVGKGDRDWGEITFEMRGAWLSLSSVRLVDSGRYSCYHRDRESFSLKVNVAEPPETPSLSCYKRSPSSKIRCEWIPQKPVAIVPNCYLFLSKSPTELFRLHPCSYSSRRSRCWCALEHNDDELRTLHMAYLCATSIAGNATSALLHFTPLDILRPDPPSDVTVRQEEGQETKMMVTWGFPISWKCHDNFFDLSYELKYQPLKSLFHGQIHVIKNQRSYTINDAMPGVEYVIQLRTKEDYDGHWSDWSAPVYASSWLPTTVKQSDEVLNYDLSATTEGGSGADVYDVSDVSEPVQTEVEVSHHILWISGSLAFLSVILAAYIFRHRDRFLPKLQSLSVVTRCGDPSRPPPSAPTLPEGQALVTFAPPCHKEPPSSEMEEENEENKEEEEQEQPLKERTEAMHFNNTSYFFLHRE